MKYLYLPFKTFSDDTAFTGTLARYKRNNHKIIERTHGRISRLRKPLKVVTATDTLIIMGHGGKDNGSRGNISVRQEKNGVMTYKNRTHNDLAQQLRDEGLPTNHRVIKTLSCYGGGAATFDVAGDQMLGDGYEYFAQLLAKSLGLLGYASVKVGGYPGTVGSTSDQKKVFFPVVNDPTGLYPVDGDGEYGTPTKGYVQWYDANGSRTVL